MIKLKDLIFERKLEAGDRVIIKGSDGKLVGTVTNVDHESLVGWYADVHWDGDPKWHQEPVQLEDLEVVK